jgi:replication-associated recombination protein RarA
MARPEKSRITSKQAMNFIFLGNPGTGKTTVARVFAKMLDELDIRKGDFEETSGQKLLAAGTASFNTLLKKVTPGVLFIDEVYQLDPKSGGGDGKAITNSLMEATENDRDKLSVIVAGTRLHRLLWSNLLSFHRSIYDMLKVKT